MPLLFLLLVLLLQLLPGFLVATTRAQAQAKVPEPVQALHIGDTVPDVVLGQVLHATSPAARLSDFKGKLLLLDFYATWCGTCLGSMPKLQELQAAFGEELQVLLVSSPRNKDNAQKVQAFYKRWMKPGDPYLLPSVVGDTTLVQFFPHRLVPHFAWISPDGRVGAITSHKEVTAENIRLALKGTMPAHLKKDVDLQRPLFSSPELPTDQLRHYSILLQGRIEGLSSGGRLRPEEDRITGRVAINKPLLDLYEMVALQRLPDYNRTRLVLEVRDRGSLLPEASALSSDEWKRRHLYSYDQAGPPVPPSEFYERMLAELNHFSPFTGSIEKRRMTCLVLRLTGRPNKLQSQGGKTESTLSRPGTKRLRHKPLLVLVKHLLSQPAIPYPVLDETGYDGPVDLDINAALDDLPALRRELRRYRLELVAAEREIEVLVIRDKPGN
ncbi:TlpA family protein disulfide reductase [Pontibacter mangrovi]|nr:TlpA disulfide reductase family protein [Pontibacter mangrovi]